MGKEQLFSKPERLLRATVNSGAVEFTGNVIKWVPIIIFGSSTIIAVTDALISAAFEDFEEALGSTGVAVSSAAVAAGISVASKYVSRGWTNFRKSLNSTSAETTAPNS